MTVSASTPLSGRALYRAAYLQAFDNFATMAPEVAETTGATVAQVRAAFKAMERKDLIASSHVNEERALTYQATETYDSISRKEALDRFDAVYPAKDEVKPVAATGRKGATGAKYTDAQIKAGIAARKKGLGWEAVATEAGVKAASYFSKAVRAAHGSDPKPAAAKAKEVVKKVAAKKPAKVVSKPLPKPAAKRKTATKRVSTKAQERKGAAAVAKIVNAPFSGAAVLAAAADAAQA